MRIVAFDTETYLIKPHDKLPKIVCLSFDDGEKAGLLSRHDAHGWLKAHLRAALNKECILVGHNLAFDTGCILRTYPDLWDMVWEVYLQGRVSCTMIRHKLIDIARGQFMMHRYTLASLAKRFFEMELDKSEDSWRLRYSELDDIPISDWPEKAKEYAIDDAIATRKLYMYQEQRTQQIGYHPIPTEKLEVRAGLCLTLMSAHGIKLDVPRVQTLWDSMREEYLAKLSGLKKSGLMDLQRFDDRNWPIAKQSNKITRELIKKHYKGAFPPRTYPSSKFPKGQIKTGKEVIEQCDCPELGLLLEAKQLQKWESTYVAKMFVDTMHAYFEVLGAKSSRTSCSNVNLQNQPRLPGVRECYVPRRGKIFTFCDYDSQESRTLAQTLLDIVGFSKMADEYKKNPSFDPHLSFAATMKGIPIEEAKRRLAAKDPDIKDARQKAKASNFGYPGGMGAETFQKYAKGYGLDLTLAECYQFKDFWFSQWPEMKDYFDVINNIIGPASCGDVIIPRSGMRRGQCGYTDASNTFFQTLGAHCTKNALWNTCYKAYNKRDSFLYGSRPVLFIHDELAFETPEFVGHEAAMELQETMIESMQEYTPDIPARASAELSRVWSKKVSAVWEDGRLVPWDESMLKENK